MNKAILVVICDFMVLSMMSMSDFATTADPAAGLVGHTGSGSNAVLDASLSEKIIQELELRNAQLEAEYAEAEAAALAGAEADKLKLESLAAELAAARVQLDYLSTRLALTPEDLGELSAEALQKLWEDEARSRELAQVRYETVTNEVTYLRSAVERSSADFRQVSDSLAEERSLKQVAEKRIDELEAELDSKTEDIAAKQEEIAAKNAAIAEREVVIREREQSLAAERSRSQSLAADLDQATDEARRSAVRLEQVTGDLETERQRLADSNSSLESARGQLEYTRGQLESIADENEANRILLAEVRSQLEAERRRAKAAEEEAMLREAELRRSLAVIERDYTQTVSELSRMRSERDSAQQQRDDYKDAMDSAVSAVRETESRNQALAEQVREAEARNLNVVQPRYKETVHNVKFSLREKRLLLDYVENREYFWPEIVLDGRSFIIGDLRGLTGYDKNRYGKEITSLDLSGTDADGNNTSVLKLFSPAADRRVALLEIEPSGRTPLRPITREELQERGLHDLYVFKAGSNGESFVLGDRGVLDIDSVSSLLRIRNRRRGREAAALAVEPGDFIMSKEGYFVGIAVGLTPKNSAGDDEAMIFVFPSGNALDGAMEIPLSATGGYYSAFVSAMSAMQNNWRVFDGGVDQ